MVPGAPSTDAPIRIDGSEGWFLKEVGGAFTGLYFSDGGDFSSKRLGVLRSLEEGPIPVRPVMIEPQGIASHETEGVTVIEDAEGLLAHRFDARPGTFYLLRPDQHVTGRWRQFEPDLVRQAVARATCNL